MSRVDTAMSRWLVYAQTHGLLSLDLRVFPPILERLRAYLQVPILYTYRISANVKDFRNFFNLVLFSKRIAKSPQGITILNFFTLGRKAGTFF